MDFPNETSLEEVLKYIRKSTIDPKAGFPKGIPIWVDPQGLTDSDKTMASPVRLELDEMPLQLTLRLITSQLGMTYELNPYGLIVITSTGCHEGEPLSEEAGNWQAFDLLRQEVHALRLEVRELRRSDRTERPAVPARGLAGGNAPNGDFGGGMR